MGSCFHFAVLMVIAATQLLFIAYRADSALVTSGDGKGSLEMMGESGYMTNDMVPRKEGCFECDNQNGNRENENRQHFRRLRIRIRRAPPPPPLGSKQRAMKVPPAPSSGPPPSSVF